MPVQPFANARGKPSGNSQGEPESAVAPADFLSSTVPSRYPVLSGRFGLSSNGQIMAASICAIFLVILFFIGVNIGLVKKTPETAAFIPPINSEDVKFCTDTQKDRFLANFKKAGNETDLKNVLSFLRVILLKLKVCINLPVTPNCISWGRCTLPIL